MFLDDNGNVSDFDDYDQKTPFERGVGKSKEDEQREFEERKRNGDFEMPLEQMPYLEENEEEIK